MLALGSFLLAVVSPLGVCLCCYPTVVTSLASIVLGHVGLYRISKSQGTQSGTVWGVLGLAISYPLFFLSLGFLLLPLFVTEAPEGPTTPGSLARRRLSEAESNVISDSRGIGHGNTDQARAMAEEVSRRMQELREELFTSRDTLLKGKFVTHCEMNDGRCAFVIHAPDLRNFESDSKEFLGELAWEVADDVATEELGEGVELGVGVKGLLLYSAVMVGKTGSDDEPRTSTSSDQLLPFFRRADDDAAAQQPVDNTGDASQDVTPPDAVAPPVEEPYIPLDEPADADAAEPAETP
jgi:hypothetical protein